MFRRHRSQPFALFALLALVVQLLASFNHGHATNDHIASLAVAAADCSFTRTNPCRSPAPDDNEDKCPICQSMGLVASAVMPEPLEIATALEVDEALQPHLSVQSVAGTPAHQFQARGPPLI